MVRRHEKSQRMRIALVDDHALVREGLAALLEGAVAGLDCLQCGTLHALLAVLRGDAPPALVLLDLGLPDVQGIEALHRLRDLDAAVPVIVVSADDRPQTVLACLEAGAAGFIPKSANFDQLLAQLSGALQGCIQLPGGLGLQVDVMPASPSFSERQHEVLELLLAGLSNKVICRQLQMSESTLKTHLGVIFRKLGVSRRAEAMVVAMSLGLRMRLGSRASEPGLAVATVQPG